MDRDYHYDSNGETWVYITDATKMLGRCLSTVWAMVHRGMISTERPLRSGRPTYLRLKDIEAIVRLITTKEAAQIAGMSQQRLNTLIKEGRGPEIAGYAGPNCRNLRFDPEHVRAWAQARRSS